MNEAVLLEVIGVIGGMCFLLAFMEAALGRWNGRSFWYEFFNLIGSVLLGWYSIQKHAYTNIVLNLVWGVVALYAIRHMIHRRQARKGAKLNWQKIYKKA